MDNTILPLKFEPHTLRRIPREENYLQNLEYLPFYNPPEIPETALARKNPSLAFEVIRTQERERTYQTAFTSGIGILNAYINNLSQEKIRKIRSIEMTVKRETPNFLRRVLTGEIETFEIDIDIDQFKSH